MSLLVLQLSIACLRYLLRLPQYIHNFYQIATNSENFHIAFLTTYTVNNNSTVPPVVCHCRNLHRAVIMKNVECGGGCAGFSRTFAVDWGLWLESRKHKAIVPAFYDLFDDVRLASLCDVLWKGDLLRDMYLVTIPCYIRIPSMVQVLFLAHLAQSARWGIVRGLTPASAVVRRASCVVNNLLKHLLLSNQKA